MVPPLAAGGKPMFGGRRSHRYAIVAKTLLSLPLAVSRAGVNLPAQPMRWPVSLLGSLARHTEVRIRSLRASMNATDALLYALYS